MTEVSVLMNCHNGQAFLREAIDSIYAQSFSNWEIVFWDNASTDSSSAIAGSYDHRLKYYHSSDLTTLGSARRAALSVCSGKWIAFLDVDDVWLPNKLSEQLSSLSNTNHIMAYAGITEMNEDGSKIRDYIPKNNTGDIFESLLFQFDMNIVTSLILSSALSDFQINFEDSITASEEYNLFMRLAAKGSVLVQPILLGKYRVSSGSLTARQIHRWSVERHFTLDQLEEENPGISLSFPHGFAEARARGIYYNAMYFASQSDFKSVRNIMKSIANQSHAYLLLYFLSYSPPFWRGLHSLRRNAIILSLFQYLQI